MNIDKFGLALRAPVAAVVLEIAHQFLLFRVNRNDRFLRGQKRHGLRIDVLKLGVAIDVLASFPRLAVGLQAIAHACSRSPTRVGQLCAPVFASSLARLRRLRPSTTRAASGRPASPARPASSDRPQECDPDVLVLRPPPALRIRPRQEQRPYDGCRITRDKSSSAITCDPRHRADPAMSERPSSQAPKAPPASPPFSILAAMSR